MNVIQDFISVGRENRPGLPLTPQFITIHETANTAAGADALMHANYLKGDEAARRPASWHFTVDDQRAVQHLPLNENAWHAGDGNGPGNLTSIAIEICVNADGNFEKAKDNAAQLSSHLMCMFNLPIERVVQHNRWSGKDCPHQIRSTGAWEKFLQNVVGYANREEEEKVIEELLKRIEALEAKSSMPVPEWAKEAVDKAVSLGIVEEPDGGSLDFYRILTIIHRKGLI